MVTTALDSLQAGRPKQVADTILGELLGGSSSPEVTSVLIHAGLARLLAEGAAGGVRELVRVLSNAPRPLPAPLVNAVEALQSSSDLSEVGRKGLALARLEVAAGVRHLSGELARLTREGLRPRHLVVDAPRVTYRGALALVRTLRVGTNASSLAVRRGQLLDGEASPTPNDTTLGRSAAGAHHS